MLPFLFEKASNVEVDGYFFWTFFLDFKAARVLLRFARHMCCRVSGSNSERSEFRQLREWRPRIPLAVLHHKAQRTHTISQAVVTALLLESWSESIPRAEISQESMRNCAEVERRKAFECNSHASFSEETNDAEARFTFSFTRLGRRQQTIRMSDNGDEHRYIKYSLGMLDIEVLEKEKQEEMAAKTLKEITHWESYREKYALLSNLLYLTRLSSFVALKTKRALISHTACAECYHLNTLKYI